MATDPTAADMGMAVPMEQLREGMKVVDAEGQEVGTIGLIRFGDPAAEQVTYQPPVIAGAAFATDVVRSEPNVPEPLRGKMLSLGFIRVDEIRHLRRDHHCYVLPYQIVAVDGDTVSLATIKAELILPS
ncbi:MAG TPA: hypothetical protein VH482_18535 [Thermomicrobiales bacterium]